ncbi:MAG: sodium-dependent transporter [Prevotellaceae bacterium]|jgi:NSS family neurotransmitter:Na+ symporter|nr:sodium-dependent transporter [Prevotellaceae bacterium]
MKSKRDGFNSSFGALMAIAGSAIGLGNLWRFPYLVGENGGSIFILFYLIFVAIVCVPVILSELVVGRKAQASIFGAFQKIAPNTGWRHLGLLAITAAVAISSFCSVIAGWTMEYVYQAAINSFEGKTSAQLLQFFTDFTTSTFRPIMWLVLYLCMVAAIILGGVKSGVEKYSKILMPLLFVLMAVLAVRTVTLPGAGAGIDFLIRPDWSKFSSKVPLNALGQAFLSLSIGMGVLVTYGSYMRKADNLTKIAIQGALADTSFAFIAAIAIIPAVFAFGMEPTQGSGLAFIALPAVFQQLPGGELFAIIFFVILFIAALTSSISLMEVQVAFMQEEWRMKRWTATLLATLTSVVLGVLCSLSFGILSSFKIFGNTIFELTDFVASNVLLPVGSLGFVIFAGWRLNKSVMYKELLQGASGSIRRLMIVMFFVLKYVAPTAILWVFLSGFGLF